MTERTGGCQCGAVRFRASALVENGNICHCRMCQKASGGLFMALVGVPRAGLVWTTGRPATFQSSAQVHRGFCRDCGTPLFYDHAENGHVSLTIGSFDAPASIPIAFEFAVDRRLPHLAAIGAVTGYRLSDEAEFVAGIEATNRQHPDHD